MCKPMCSGSACLFCVAVCSEVVSNDDFQASNTRVSGPPSSHVSPLSEDVVHSINSKGVVMETQLPRVEGLRRSQSESRLPQHAQGEPVRLRPNVGHGAPGVRRRGIGDRLFV